MIPFLLIWFFWSFSSFGIYILSEDRTFIATDILLLFLTIVYYIPLSCYMSYVSSTSNDNNHFYILTIIMFFFFLIPFNDNNMLNSILKSVVRIILFSILYVLVYFRLSNQFKARGIEIKILGITSYILFGYFYVIIVVAIISIPIYCILITRKNSNKNLDLHLDNSTDYINNGEEEDSETD